MKPLHYFTLLLGFITFSALDCNKESNSSNPTKLIRFQCGIDEGNGFTNYSTQNPTYNQTGANEYEVEASLTDGRYIYFKFNKVMSPNTIDLASGGNYAVYHSADSVTYASHAGTLIITAFDDQELKMNGTFDDLIMVAPGGDTVLVEGGVFNIDM